MFTSDFAEPFIEDFAREYGERRVRKVVSKVDDSRKIRNYFIKLQEIRLPPHPKDIVVTIMSIPFFAVANKYTVGLACVYLLMKWNEDFNDEGSIASDSELERIFRGIMAELRQM